MMPALWHHHLVIRQFLGKNRLTGERILGVDPLRDVFLPRFLNRVGGFIEMTHERSAVAKGDNVQIQSTRLAKRMSATVERGTRCKNVIDQNVMLMRN